MAVETRRGWEGGGNPVPGGDTAWLADWRLAGAAAGWVFLGRSAGNSLAARGRGDVGCAAALLSLGRNLLSVLA